MSTSHRGYFLGMINYSTKITGWFLRGSPGLLLEGLLVEMAPELGFGR